MLTLIRHGSECGAAATCPMAALRCGKVALLTIIPVDGSESGA